MNQQPVWITGAGGLIGSYFVRTAAECVPQFNAIGLTRSELDLTNEQAVRDRFHRDKPDLIIHCAALSKSPACQADPALARKLNVDVTKLLAELATEIPFLFFSTDLVFDGTKGWYTETDAPNPLSVYAETKVAAEQIVLKNPRHAVIRTSLNGGTSPTGDRGFNEELRRAWQSGKVTRLFVDEFRCPIAANETARAVWGLAQKNATGIFHVAGSERLSRWQIGELLAARSKVPPRIEQSSLREYQGPPRSPDTSLDSTKVEKILGRVMPAFSEWLKKAIDF